MQSALRDFGTGLELTYGLQRPLVVVYGSYPRGEANEDSDLDLLLLFSEPVNASREIDNLSSLLAELNLKYGLLLAVFPAWVGDYREGAGPFWRNVRREGIALHESA